MLDIKFLRENPDAVKENIKKKFQDEKLPLVDEVVKFDLEYRESKTKGDALRGDRNRISKEIGMLYEKYNADSNFIGFSFCITYLMRKNQGV